MGGQLRHRPGSVGVTALAVTQECTQIGENGLSVPFWGIRVHCCAVGLGCGWPWDRNSVHKWEDRASPHRIGAFVYTVGLLGCCAVVDRCEDAIVYTDHRKRPLGAVSGHLCTLLRRESRYESRRELRQVAQAPQPPWRAGGAPSLALSLGREDRLCASGAAARLASSPRRQPTRTPEEPDIVLCLGW